MISGEPETPARSISSSVSSDSETGDSDNDSESSSSNPGALYEQKHRKDENWILNLASAARNPSQASQISGASQTPNERVSRVFTTGEREHDGDGTMVNSKSGHLVLSGSECSSSATGTTTSSEDERSKTRLGRHSRPKSGLEETTQLSARHLSSPQSKSRSIGAEGLQFSSAAPSGGAFSTTRLSLPSSASSGAKDPDSKAIVRSRSAVSATVSSGASLGPVALGTRKRDRRSVEEIQRDIRAKKDWTTSLPGSRSSSPVPPSLRGHSASSMSSRPVPGSSPIPLPPSPVKTSPVFFSLQNRSGSPVFSLDEELSGNEEISGPSSAFRLAGSGAQRFASSLAGRALKSSGKSIHARLSKKKGATHSSGATAKSKGRKRKASSPLTVGASLAGNVSQAGSPIVSSVTATTTPPSVASSPVLSEVGGVVLGGKDVFNGDSWNGQKPRFQRPAKSTAARQTKPNVGGQLLGGLGRLSGTERSISSSLTVERILDQRTIERLPSHSSVPSHHGAVKGIAESSCRVCESERQSGMLQLQMQSVTEYLVKWSGKSFLHCTWEIEQTLMGKYYGPGSNGGAILIIGGQIQLQNYNNQNHLEQSFSQSAAADEQESLLAYKEQLSRLRSSYGLVETILSVRSVNASQNAELSSASTATPFGTRLEYLCKWFGLPYTAATWESETDIKAIAQTAFARFQALQTFKQESKRLSEENSPVGTKEVDYRNLPECIHAYLEETMIGNKHLLLQLTTEDVSVITTLLRSYCESRRLVWLGVAKSSRFLASLSVVMAPQVKANQTFFSISDSLSPLSSFLALVVCSPETFLEWKIWLQTLLSDKWRYGSIIIYHGDERNLETIRNHCLCQLPQIILTCHERMLLEKEFFHRLDLSWTIIEDCKMLRDQMYDVMMRSSQLFVVSDGKHQRASPSMFCQTVRGLSSRTITILSPFLVSQNIERLAPKKFTTHLWPLLNATEPAAFPCQQEFTKSVQAALKTKQAWQEFLDLLRPFALIDRSRSTLSTERTSPINPAYSMRTLLCPLSQLQRRYLRGVLISYLAYLISTDEEAQEHKEESTLHTSVNGRPDDVRMSFLADLRQVCNQPLLYPRARGEALELYGEEAIIYGSGKFRILDMFLRKHLDSPAFPVSSDLQSVSAVMPSYPSKHETSRAAGNERRRFIIVASSAKTLNLLEEFCSFRNLGYTRLDGQMDRARLRTAVSAFNSPSSQAVVLLISSQALSVTGPLPLARVTHLILFDSCVPLADTMEKVYLQYGLDPEKLEVFRLVSQVPLIESGVSRHSQSRWLQENACIIVEPAIGSPPQDGRINDDSRRILNLLTRDFRELLWFCVSTENGGVELKGPLGLSMPYEGSARQHQSLLQNLKNAATHILDIRQDIAADERLAEMNDISQVEGDVCDHYTRRRKPFSETQQSWQSLISATVRAENEVLQGIDPHALSIRRQELERLFHSVGAFDAETEAKIDYVLAAATVFKIFSVKTYDGDIAKEDGELVHLDADSIVKLNAAALKCTSYQDLQWRCKITPDMRELRFGSFGVRSGLVKALRKSENEVLLPLRAFYRHCEQALHRSDVSSISTAEKLTLEIKDVEIRAFECVQRVWLYSVLSWTMQNLGLPSRRSPVGEGKDEECQNLTYSKLGIQAQSWRFAEGKFGWNEQKDCALLYGVYKHGFNSWKEIWHDPALGLWPQEGIAASTDLPASSVLHDTFSPALGERIRLRVTELITMLPDIPGFVRPLSRRIYRLGPEPDIEKTRKGLERMAQTIQNQNTTNSFAEELLPTLTTESHGGALPTSSILPGGTNKGESEKTKHYQALNQNIVEIVAISQAVRASSLQSLKPHQAIHISQAEQRTKDCEPRDYRGDSQSKRPIEQPSARLSVSADSNPPSLSSTWTTLDAKILLKDVRKTLKKLQIFPSWASGQNDDFIARKAERYLIEVGDAIVHIRAQLEDSEEPSSREVEMAVQALWEYAASFTPLPASSLSTLYSSVISERTKWAASLLSTATESSFQRPDHSFKDGSVTRDRNSQSEICVSSTTFAKATLRQHSPSESTSEPDPKLIKQSAPSRQSLISDGDSSNKRTPSILLKKRARHAAAEEQKRTMLREAEKLTGATDVTKQLRAPAIDEGDFDHKIRRGKGDHRERLHTESGGVRKDEPEVRRRISSQNWSERNENIAHPHSAPINGSKSIPKEVLGQDCSDRDAISGKDTPTAIPSNSARSNPGPLLPPHRRSTSMLSVTSILDDPSEEWHLREEPADSGQSRSSLIREEDELRSHFDSSPKSMENETQTLEMSDSINFGRSKDRRWRESREKGPQRQHPSLSVLDIIDSEESISKRAYLDSPRISSRSAVSRNNLSSRNLSRQESGEITEKSKKDYHRQNGAQTGEVSGRESHGHQTPSRHRSSSRSSHPINTQSTHTSLKFPQRHSRSRSRSPRSSGERTSRTSSSYRGSSTSGMTSRERRDKAITRSPSPARFDAKKGDYLPY